MTFGGPVFISIGDEYDKKNAGAPDRFKGRSFVTNPPKKGAGVDTLFSKKFVTLSDGDKYVDPGYFERRQRIEAEKKKLTPQGFRFASGPKSMGGAGTYYGTFSERDPPKHEIEYAVAKKGEQPDQAQAHLRNIVVGAPKRGTAGGDFQYISCPYDERKSGEAANGRGKAKALMGPAFRAACKRGGFFDETNHGVSKVYSIDRALPAKKPSTADAKAPVAGKAWRPGGSLSTIQTRPPPYMEDPYEAKEKAAREERLKHKSERVWKPIGGSKTLPTKPIKFTPM